MRELPPGAVLSVWAHPDDECYLAGGLMATAVERGQRVVCVCATHATGPRAVELERALEVLGVTEHLHLGQPDGGCADVDPAGPVTQLLELLECVQPATVLTFGPDGITGHADHQAVGAWVEQAVVRSERSTGRRPRLLRAVLPPDHLREHAEVYERLGVYMVDEPPVPPDEPVSLELQLSGDLLERKVRALEAHASQTGPAIELIGRPLFAEWVSAEAYWG